MAHTQVCIVSDQPIPNLITPKQGVPKHVDRVILLRSPEMKVQGARLAALFTSWGKTVKTQEMAAYDLDKAIEVCDAVAAEAGDDCSLNITGGTKVQTVAAFQVFYTQSKPIVYVDTQDNKILSIAPQAEPQPILAQIKAKDYLAAYGFTLNSATGTASRETESRGELRRLLLRAALENERSLGALNDSLARGIREERDGLVRFTLKDDHAAALDDLLVRSGVRRAGPEYILGQEMAAYLNGLWVEEHAFLAALTLKGRGLIQECWMNAKGEWDLQRAPPQNEFDLVLARGARLYIVECKSLDPNRREGGEGILREHLYKLDSLGDRALGLFGKKMMLSARPIKDEYVKSRAAAMGIKLVDGADLSDLENIFSAWVQTP
jgi:hypothetical protein